MPRHKFGFALSWTRARALVILPCSFAFTSSCMCMYFVIRVMLVEDSIGQGIVKTIVELNVSLLSVNKCYCLGFLLMLRTH